MPEPFETPGKSRAARSIRDQGGSRNVCKESQQGRGDENKKVGENSLPFSHSFRHPFLDFPAFIRWSAAKYLTRS